MYTLYHFAVILSITGKERAGDVLLKTVHFIFGILMLILGVLGAVLPVLPTTPFVLASTYCFARSSPEFHSYIVNNRFYQKHLAKSVESKSMTRRTKASILTFSSVCILSVFFSTVSVALRIFLLVVLCVQYLVFIFYIKTSS